MFKEAFQSSFLSIICFFIYACGVTALRPVVFWHGMGDSCCGGIANLTSDLQSWIPGLFAYSIRLGNDEDEDRKAGFFGIINDQVIFAVIQVDSVCAMLKTIKELKDGFNAVGFSQGGLFMRAYVERCNDPPVHNLITLGSPHSGTGDVPNCEVSDLNCSLMRAIVKQGVYWNWVQRKVVQAQYFKEYTNIEGYLKSSIFLPHINNEVVVNSLYKQRLQSLNKLVLVQFSNDTMIVPKETAHFGILDENGIVVPLKQQEWYKRDQLGLKTMVDGGKIDFLEIIGNHMQFTRDDFKEIAEKYLVEQLVLNIQ
jgi:palmitoyl-protein thioesterase